MGGKQKLLWLIDKLAPAHYGRFIDVFGGSGTVLLNRPIRRGCMEVYNDYNSNLTNLFFCVRERTLALLVELSFLPLNSRDGFNDLLSFFQGDEFTDEYLSEELELADKYLSPPHANAVKKLLLKRAQRGDVKRAANYYKLIRYSFSGGGKSFAGRSCNIRSFFWQIWLCSRRLADVVVENKDFEELISQYDREDAFIYCDPPYFEAEGCYTVEFPKRDHRRLHDAVRRCKGKVMVSYNYCPYICELYDEFYIFHTTRHDSMSQTRGKVYEEVVITNYDPRECSWQLSLFNMAGDDTDCSFQLVHEPDLPLGLTESGKIIFEENDNEVCKREQR